MKMDAEFTRQRPEGGQRRVAFLGRDGRQQTLAVAVEDRRHFGGQDVLRARRCRRSDESCRVGDVGGDLDAAPHLHGRCPEGAHAETTFSPAGSGTSPPARCKAYRSSQPPTWRSPMKICGKVMPPWLRSIISARSSGLPVASCSIYGLSLLH